MHATACNIKPTVWWIINSESIRQTLYAVFVFNHKIQLRCWKHEIDDGVVQELLTFGINYDELWRNSGIYLSVTSTHIHRSCRTGNTRALAKKVLSPDHKYMKTEKLFCSDRRARVPSELWKAEAATIEITRRNHSIVTCSRQIHMGVILRAHPVRGESCMRRPPTRVFNMTNTFSPKIKHNLVEIQRSEATVVFDLMTPNRSSST